MINEKDLSGNIRTCCTTPFLPFFAMKITIKAFWVLKNSAVPTYKVITNLGAQLEMLFFERRHMEMG